MIHLLQSVADSGEFVDGGIGHVGTRKTIWVRTIIQLMMAPLVWQKRIGSAWVSFYDWRKLPPSLYKEILGFLMVHSHLIVKLVLNENLGGILGGTQF
jgi:hypothetical protein